MLLCLRLSYAPVHHYVHMYHFTITPIFSYSAVTNVIFLRRPFWIQIKIRIIVHSAIMYFVKNPYHYAFHFVANSKLFDEAWKDSNQDSREIGNLKDKENMISKWFVFDVWTCLQWWNLMLLTGISWYSIRHQQSHEEHGEARVRRQKSSVTRVTILGTWKYWQWALSRLPSSLILSS